MVSPSWKTLKIRVSFKKKRANFFGSFFVYRKRLTKTTYKRYNPPAMVECIFCKIVKGEIPADIIYRDEQVVAFKDLNPQAPFHVLVIPTKHVEKVSDPEAANGEMLSGIFKAIQKLAKDNNLEEGFRVVTNCGEFGGQTVYHIHFHLLGKRQLNWPPG